MSDAPDKSEPQPGDFAIEKAQIMEFTDSVCSAMNATEVLILANLPAKSGSGEKVSVIGSSGFEGSESRVLNRAINMLLNSAHAMLPEGNTITITKKGEKPCTVDEPKVIDSDFVEKEM